MARHSVDGRRIPVFSVLMARSRERFLFNINCKIRDRGGINVKVSAPRANSPIPMCISIAWWFCSSGRVARQASCRFVTREDEVRRRARAAPWYWFTVSALEASRVVEVGY
jgi:hypothetical protein